MYVIEITELDEDENANPENFRQISNTIDIQVEDTDSVCLMFRKGCYCFAKGL